MKALKFEAAQAPLGYGKFGEELTLAYISELPLERRQLSPSSHAVLSMSLHCLMLSLVPRVGILS
jgi:hypothetical protein